MKKNNKGFTLVELIVVIAILGVLMAVLVPQYIQYVEKSRIGVDEAMIGEFAHNMELAAATNEELSKATGVTVTVKGTGETGSFTVAPPEGATDKLKAAVETLKSDLEGVFPVADVKFKSKIYSSYSAEGIKITLSNGKAKWDTKTVEKS